MIIRIIHLLIVLISLTAVVNQPVYCQHFPVSSITSEKEIWFDEIIGIANSGLINGQEYIIPLQASRTHPFFGSREITYENLEADGQRFGNVPIMYDIYSNIVVLRHRDKNGLFAPIQIKNVNGFTLYGHTFKNLSLTDIKGNRQTPQLFDVLMEGYSVSLIAKRKKEIYLEDSKPEYRQQDLFYFLINGQQVSITRKKNIYKAFDILQDNVRNFINTNKLNIGIEKDLLRISQYCDSLYKAKGK